MNRLVSAVTALAAVGAFASPAQARHKEITPYIEVGQVLTADLQSGDVLTYSTVAAGIDASVHTKRVEFQISYRYERRFSYDNKLDDADVHSGLARAAVRVVPGLSVEGGALATRSRVDVRGAAPGVLTGNVSNISQIYSAYAGPSLGTHVGPIGVSAGYRFGYTKVEAPTSTGVAPGQPKLDTFDESRSQQAQASLNLKSGTLLPVGITVSGAWEREDAGQLDQRFEGKYARGDVVLPVTRSIALVAGAGYENIRATQKDPLRDTAGQPVTDSRGRFVTDPASPQRIAYSFDGIYYDAGVVWRPSPRTQLEARVGKRYGSTSYTGSFSYQPTKSLALRVGVYDGIQTFGRQLRDGISSIPTSYTVNGNPLGDFNGCVFGTSGGGAGGCLNSALQSVSSSVYRARGVDAVVSVNRGPLHFGVGAGYANRHFFAPPSVAGFTVDEVSDDSYYASAFIGRALDSNTTVDLNVFANYFKSGIPGAAGVYGAGATGSLTHNFGRLQARASAGIYTFGQKGTQDQITAQALLGARYQF